MNDKIPSYGEKTLSRTVKDWILPSLQTYEARFTEAGGWHGFLKAITVARELSRNPGIRFTRALHWRWKQMLKSCWNHWRWAMGQWFYMAKGRNVRFFSILQLMEVFGRFPFLLLAFPHNLKQWTPNYCFKPLLGRGIFFILLFYFIFCRSGRNEAKRIEDSNCDKGGLDRPKPAS